MNRREFFQTSSAVALAGSARGANASTPKVPSPGFGVLCDVTQCVGCRKCEWACNQANALPVGQLATFENRAVFAHARRPDAGHFTVVNETREAPDSKPTWVKVQCMHCLEPACASACIVSALERDPRGPVTYDADRCIGCRYCMVACPFQVPAYEYEDPLTPRVRKCTLCADRVLKIAGAVPACVEICPPQCLTFGARSDVLALAHSKIAKHPERYLDHVYGEHEVGGTAWLYVSGRPYESLGLPVLPTEPTPARTEPLQHAIFKNFVPPVALFSLLFGISWLLRRRTEPVPAEAPLHAPAPVAAGFRTRGVAALLFLGIAALAAFVARFVMGLGAVTHLDDQYPWGIWIAVDVAAGVALSAAGFTTAALAHVFHRDDFEPIARPALLSALLGYTFVVLGLAVDLGRPYRLWHPMMPSMWSGHSVLFEVGMCVMAYLTVLYLEFSPVVLESARTRPRQGRFAAWNRLVEFLLAGARRGVRAIMPVLLVAGVVLSCLHQSSLGALMLLAPTKMHPLWYTPVLPLLFLMSAIMVGYPVVVLESLLSARAFRRPAELPLLGRLARIVPVLLGVYFVAKIADLTIREQWSNLLVGDVPSRAYLTELVVGVMAPLAIFASERARKSARMLLLGALLVIGGVVLNRVNVFLVAYRPPYAERPYFPSAPEIALTLGLFATLALVYRLLVTRFAVLARAPEERDGVPG